MWIKFENKKLAQSQKRGYALLLFGFVQESCVAI